MELEAHILNFLRIDGVRVEEQLQLHHLQQLMHWFQSHQPPIEEHPADEFVHPSHRHQYRKPGLLTLQEFKDTLAIVLNTRSFDNQLDNLFAKLDTSSDGFVDWNEFCTYMLLQFRENDYMRTKQLIPFQTEAKMRHIIQNKQETTTKIVAVEGPTKFVTFGKDGALCVWSQSLHFEKCYKLCDSDEEQRGATKRRVKEWVTDAVYMPNCHKLAVASTGRDIRFYDTTTASQYIEEYCLFGFPDVPSCLDYWHETLEAGGKSSLFYGDDHGNIHVLHFTRVHIQMFSTPFKKDEGVRKIYFPDIQAHDDLDFVSYARLEFSHTYAIKKIVYMPDNDCVAVCTSCSRGSLVIADVQNKRKTYSFSITKGVDCFDYNKNLNSLVTGSADHVVRMWNPYVTSRPVAILQGHSMAVIDVKIQEDLNEIFSFSRDAVLRIWDMKEQICIQTVLLKFPSGFLGRLPEFGPFPMHLQQNPKVLLVVANDYVAMLKLGPSAPTTSKTPVTHSTQLCSAIYNPRFKQVVTAADDSTVALWDLETGAKSMLFANAHGNEEITCLAMDDSGRRLMTGARNGTIKIWNVQNGHNLHQLEAVEESEVTGIIQVIERKTIMAVGWNRKIVQYDDSQPDTVFIKADTSWKGGHIHTEDILSAALCPPNLLATASFDGEICVWFIETESLFKKLRKSQPIRTSARVSAITSNAYESNPDGNAPGQPDGARDQSANNSRSNSRANSRPNSRHRRNHKPPYGQAAPVDKLLFLLERAKSKLPDVAILISSEAGTLRWWNVFGKKHEMGYFYAADQMDESVLGMCTDRTNAVLVTGDNVGKIAVWDISKYCTGPSAHKTRSSPDVRSSWTGHTQAVVSVELAELNSVIYVVSASADTTAKLWTLDGAPIGTFGQSEPWTLHPMSSPDEKTVNDVKERTDPTSTRSLDKSGETEKEGDKDTTLSNKDENVLTTQNGKTEGLSDNLKTKQPSASGKENLLNSEDPSQPPSNDVQQTTKVGLGSRVVEQLARVKQDRQDRREHFADIDYTVTNRRGTLQCCAYRAIELPPLMDVRVSDNLPDTSDYLSRTYNGLQDSGGGNNPNGDRPRQRKRSLIQSRFQLPSLSRNNSSMSSQGQQGTSVSTRRYSRGSVSCRPIVELSTQVE